MLITNRCVLCEQCVSACPVMAISIPKGSDKAEIDKGTCVKCGYCMTICPVDAITDQDGDI